MSIRVDEMRCDASGSRTSANSGGQSHWSPLQPPARLGLGGLGGGQRAGSSRPLLSCLPSAPHIPAHPAGMSPGPPPTGSSPRALNCSLPTGPRKRAQPHNQQPYSSLWQDAHVAICPQTCPRGRWHRRRGTGQAQGLGGLRGAVAPARTLPDPGGPDGRRRGSAILLGRNSSVSAFCLHTSCHLPLSLLSGTAPSSPRLPPAGAARDQC